MNEHDQQHAQQHDGKTEVGKELFRSGFIALVGRPSVGKSTLLNSLCGQKVAIISPKPQTTRNVIRGIVNRTASQICFLDTPGFTEAENFLATQLREELRSAVGQAEAVLYLVDLSRPVQHPQKIAKELAEPLEETAQELLGGEEEQGLLALLQAALEKYPRPLCVALNKIDLLPEGKLRTKRIESYLHLLRQYFPTFEISQCFAVSASKKEGLEALLSCLEQKLPEGAALYDTEIYTDQEPTFRIQELIREQALSFCGRELPYALYVEVADLEYRPTDQFFASPSERRKLSTPPDPPELQITPEEGQSDSPELETVLWVRAFLQVERDSQKGILVGKGGTRIRQIRKRSSKAIRKEFACAVHLDLQVKVDYKWRRNKHR